MNEKVTLKVTLPATFVELVGVEKGWLPVCIDPGIQTQVTEIEGAAEASAAPVAVAKSRATPSPTAPMAVPGSPRHAGEELVHTVMV